MESLEIGERGVAGPEVVDGEAQTEPTKPPQDPLRERRGLHQDALRDLQRQARRRQPRLGEDLGDGILEVLSRELAGGDVHGDLQLRVAGIRRAPPGELPAGLAENPLPQWRDESRLLRHRDELGGANQTLLRVVPPDQRLDRLDPPISHADERLVVDAEVAAVHCAAKLVLGRQSPDRPDPHVVVEEFEASAAALLGPIHRRVGVADQGLGPVVPRARQRDADTGGDDQLRGVDFDGLRDDATEPIGDAHRLLITGHVLAEQDELIPAEARPHVAGSQRGTEPVGHADQHPVTGLVAQAVVDDLEAVEVEEQDRHGGPMTGRPRQGLVELLDEQNPVGQPGEGIV